MNESYENLAHKFLSQREADFFLDYPKDSARKAAKDKVRYYRLKTELVKNMIMRWLDRRDKPE